MARRVHLQHHPLPPTRPWRMYLPSSRLRVTGPLSSMHLRRLALLARGHRHGRYHLPGLRLPQHLAQLRHPRRWRTTRQVTHTPRPHTRPRPTHTLCPMRPRRSRVILELMCHRCPHYHPSRVHHCTAAMLLAGLNALRASRRGRVTRTRANDARDHPDAGHTTNPALTDPAPDPVGQTPHADSDGMTATRIDGH